MYCGTPQVITTSGLRSVQDYLLYSSTKTFLKHSYFSNFSYPNNSIIQMPKVTVLLEYFVVGVCFIRVALYIRKSKGFSYLNILSRLLMILIEQSCALISVITIFYHIV